MSKHRLPTPMLQVTMRDGAEFEVQCLNIDLVSWDRERARHKWPNAQDAPFMWMEYLAWHALTKTQGLVPACSLADFGAQVAAITSRADGEGEDGDGVDPTTTVAELD